MFSCIPKFASWLALIWPDSRQSLKKYVRANNNIQTSDNMFDALFNRALKNGVEKGIFEQPKGTVPTSASFPTRSLEPSITDDTDPPVGASGGTKLAKQAAKPSAAKKPAAKKEAGAKKETAAKKTTSKKAAPKKEAGAKKETKEKKAAPKKATAKKATVSCQRACASMTVNLTHQSQAPAVVDKPTVLTKTKSGRVAKTTAKPAAPRARAAPKKPAAKKE